MSGDKAAGLKVGPEDKSLWEAFNAGELIAWDMMADGDYAARMVRTGDGRYLVALYEEDPRLAPTAEDGQALIDAYLDGPHPG